ncbi:DNA primase [Campylobacter mucosalis]|uniref:DNA primase n=1 Tax=Campylobacter mucosalis TaxID=202 RepID=UPI0004D40F72|nr:DNA primase [Campylobacter mucosalis]KEA45267.1 DNA primase [Campylobacter mucosalis]QKF63719.1 DNA primase [Campylobacter mucosalis]
MIEASSIQKLKDTIDIVDIISHYVPVKKMGSNFKCVCPFHDDKNPSMSINPQKQFYHCFSCKAGGDAIKFVMDYEKISYPEAVEKVASIANFTLSYTADMAEKKENKHILENVNAMYRADLFKNKDALNYLYSRGINDAMIEKFELGWADDGLKTIRLLENDKIEPKEALEVGIVKQNERGIYASFSHRITFPIYSHTTRLVGFGGRTISDHPAKYINSPQSNLFDKSRLLYGYHLARRSIAQKKQMIITEGYLDVIMLHYAGFDNAVAVLGTALTQKHLPILKRDEASIVLCFDGDSAGINAAVRSAHLLSLNEIDASVVIIDGGADPADMVFAGKIDYLKALFSSGVEIGEFYIRHIAKSYDLSRPIQKQKCLDEILAYTKSLKAVIASSYAPLVASLLNIDVSSLNLGGLKSQMSFSPKIYKERNLPTQAMKKDILELCILKSIMANANFKQELISQDITHKYFLNHENFFKAVFSPKADGSDIILRELELDESAKLIDDEAKFQKALINLKLKYYEKMQQDIKNSNLADKLEKLELITQIILELKRKI